MLKEITADRDRCGDSLVCPAVFEESGKLVIVGKIASRHGLASRIGPGEIAIEIDTGIVERALAGRVAGNA